MSTYNMVCGFDPLAPVVLLALGFDTPEKRAAIPRLRDAYVRVPRAGDPEQPSLCILTRTGGGNRAEYAAENEALASMPGFRCDFDDDFDNTFAHWCYEFPEEHLGALAEVLEAATAKGWLFPYPMERFQKAIDDMGN